MNDYDLRRLADAADRIEKLAGLIWLELSLIRRKRTEFPSFAELDAMLSPGGDLMRELDKAEDADQPPDVA